MLQVSDILKNKSIVEVYVYTL